MPADDKVNILLVDDLPAKLLSYETILAELGENLIKAASAREALEHLLKQDIALILVDVCMPELDGFQLAAMIREHPRFQRTAIIFISAIHLTDVDRLRAYEMGAVDYVPVPVVPELLRAKVRIFAELYRKTRQLEQLNHELERRVAERTAELEASTARLMQSEERRSLALAAGQMGSWEWDPLNGDFTWDDGQYRIFGVDPAGFDVTVDNIRELIHPEDWKHLAERDQAGGAGHAELPDRISRLPSQWRVALVHRDRRRQRRCDRQYRTHQRRDRRHHRPQGSRGAPGAAWRARSITARATRLALVQSIVRLTRADTIKSYIAAVDGRIGALSRAHTLLAQSRWQGADLARLVDEELAPYRAGDVERITSAGPDISLEPRIAQTLALALHELSTNAAKYGALSVMSGHVNVTWELHADNLVLHWTESGGPSTQPPASPGFGIRVISASIERQLEGEAAFHWRPEGLRCSLCVPRGDKIEPSARRAGVQWSADEEQAQPAAAARDRQPRAAGRGRDPGRHDDARHLDGARLYRRRTLQPARRGHGRGRARGDRRRHHRRQSRGRIRLSRRRCVGGAQDSVRLRHGLWGREHRPPVRLCADHQEAGATAGAAADIRPRRERARDISPSGEAGPTASLAAASAGHP